MYRFPLGLVKMVPNLRYRVMFQGSYKSNVGVDICDFFLHLPQVERVLKNRTEWQMLTIELYGRQVHLYKVKMRPGREKSSFDN